MKNTTIQELEKRGEKRGERRGGLRATRQVSAAALRGQLGDAFAPHERPLRRCSARTLASVVALLESPPASKRALLRRLSALLPI